jgi:hypothetical protein
MNQDKLRLALTLLDQAMNEPDPKPKTTKIVQERYFRVSRVRYDSQFLKLQPFYGSPKYADARVVMEYDSNKLDSGRVLDFEIMR